MRASTKRPSTWTITPRCLDSMGAIGPRRTGGEIFSNVKAGIVYPLFVELKHSGWTRRHIDKQCCGVNVPSGLMCSLKLKHVLCQIYATLPFDCRDASAPIG